MHIKSHRVFTLIAAAGMLAGCAANKNNAANEGKTNSAATPDAVYVAELQPLNSKVTGLKTHGQARFTLSGDQLTIDITVEDAPPTIEHWQHFHGFKNGGDARVATAADDANHDGIIDLIETERASGTTMVPFNDDPAAMDVAVNTYPKASADGSYHYHQVVSLAKLKASFAKTFPGQNLDWTHRVVYIHGVATDAKLPNSVASLGTIPASTTLPIAGGKIRPAE